MDLSTLERTIRMTIGGGAMQPAFAALAAGNLALSPELANAARTLAARAEQDPRPASPLGKVAEMWA